MTHEANIRGSVRHVLGENVRRLREGHGWLQDHLAAEVRVAGPAWTRSTVAAIENDRREISVADLVALSFALQAPLSVLLGSGGGYIDLGEGVTVQADVLQQNIAKDTATLPHDSPALAARRQADSYREHDEVEEHAARKLARSRVDIRDAARQLWQQPLATERDERLEAAGPADGLRGRRGHITRQLLTELVTHFETKDSA